MFFLLYSLLQLLILWMLLSMLFRLFKGDTARRDEWKQYSEWTYGSERQGGYGWSGPYGENPFTAGSSSALADAYRTLGISPEATDSEVKSAFKRLAVRFHPDKYATESQDVQHAAEEKFKQVNEAYQRIRKQRGLDS